MNPEKQNCSPWYPLFEHIARQHGLTLTDSECNEIAAKADESRLKSSHDGVTWILINALRLLDDQQLHSLYDEIGKRISGTSTMKVP